MPVHPASIAASRTVVVPTLFSASIRSASRRRYENVAAAWMAWSQPLAASRTAAASVMSPVTTSMRGVVRVQAEQREVLAQLRGCPHERTDLMVLLEESLQDVDAEEPGCAREQDNGHGPQSFARRGRDTGPVGWSWEVRLTSFGHGRKWIALRASPLSRS